MAEAMKSKIIRIGNETHDTIKILLEKPEGFRFCPGDYTLLGIENPEWKYAKRPFTMTSLPKDVFLEFIIKVYPERNGFTKALSELQPGDVIIIENPSGTIRYKGPGIFIAAGSGITPFISIFRSLESPRQNRLLYTNRTRKDVILEKELKDMLGDRAEFFFTREEPAKRIDENVIKNSGKYENFYVCGPPGFTKSVSEIIKSMGANPGQISF